MSCASVSGGSHVFWCVRAHWPVRITTHNHISLRTCAHQYKSAHVFFHTDWRTWRIGSENWIQFMSVFVWLYAIQAITIGRTNCIWFSTSQVFVYRRENPTNYRSENQFFRSGLLYLETSLKGKWTSAKCVMIQAQVLFKSMDYCMKYPDKYVMKFSSIARIRILRNP